MLIVNGGRYNQKRSIEYNTEEACRMCFSNQTTFWFFVQLSFEELDTIPRMEINRQQGEFYSFSLTLSK